MTTPASGAGLSARQPVTVKYRRSTLRAIAEIADLLGGISRESVIQIMLLDGIEAARSRLGLTDEPAAVAYKLLTVVQDSWADDLSTDEHGAFQVVRAALGRITDLNARDVLAQGLEAREAQEPDRAGKSPS